MKSRFLTTHGASHRLWRLRASSGRGVDAPSALPVSVSPSSGIGTAPYNGIRLRAGSAGRGSRTVPSTNARVDAATGRSSIVSVAPTRRGLRRRFLELWCHKLSGPDNPGRPCCRRCSDWTMTRQILECPLLACGGIRPHGVAQVGRNRGTGNSIEFVVLTPDAATAARRWDAGLSLATSMRKWTD